MKFYECSQGDQRRTRGKLRTLRTQHPAWEKADSAVGGFAIDAFTITVLAPPADWQGEAKEGVPTVVHRYRFQIVCIMCVNPWASI